MEFSAYNYEGFEIKDSREQVEIEFRYALFDELLCQVDLGKITLDQAIARHKWDYPLPQLDKWPESGTM